MAQEIVPWEVVDVLKLSLLSKAIVHRLSGRNRSSNNRAHNEKQYCALQRALRTLEASQPNHALLQLCNYAIA